MTQAERLPTGWRRAALAAVALAALTVSVLAVAIAGCQPRRLLAPETRPGAARCAYWVWPGFDLTATLAPAAAVHPRWDEFVGDAGRHRILAHDFMYFEGHPAVVDATWRDHRVPAVTGPDYINYRSAGRWHVVHRHFAPNSMSLYYLRMPDGRRIDNADADLWRFPAGAEIVQLIYRHKLDEKQEASTAHLVEWRRMRVAGTGLGQMRSDGSRSDWVFESAIRDPVTDLWRRTREDGHDVRWVTLGKGNSRFRWPVVRPHTCAECHRLAGKSPLDGPRGGGEVYTLGDLQEAGQSGNVAALVPVLRYPASAAARARGRPMPPDPDERYRTYVEMLARQRSEALEVTEAQQRALESSPFAADDKEAQARGREIYLTQCAACHGLEAAGGGPLALRRPSPPSLKRRPAEQILKAVRQGRGAMPSWAAVLPGDEQWRLIEYLDSSR